MRSGVRRLLLLTAAPSRANVERLMTDAGRLVVAKSDIALATLVDDCIAATVDAVITEHGALPWTRAAYDELRVAVRAAAGRSATALASAAQVIAAAVAVQDQLAGLRADAAQPSVADANAHLGRLVRPGFVLHAGLDRLDDVERYVRGIGHRLSSLAGGIERDRRRMDEVRPLEQRYAALVDRLGRGVDGSELAELGWQLEELRIATFAQPLGVRGQVSTKRLRRTLDRLERELESG
jgi:ATP-dependent helicase HrpA